MSSCRWMPSDTLLCLILCILVLPLCVVLLSSAGPQPEAKVTTKIEYVPTYVLVHEDPETGKRTYNILTSPDKLAEVLNGGPITAPNPEEER